MSRRDTTRRPSRGLRRLLVVVGPLLPAAWALFMLGPASASAPTGSVTISPAVSGGASGPYQDGETVKIGVGRNGTFQPGSRVNILECADPGGSAANLPKNDTTCDGLTIQGDTVLVGADGTISYSSYTLYRLPSTTLGESATGQPVCNESNPCVLYVGENQNAFAQPKLFSAPFTVVAASASAAATSTSVTPSVTLPGGQEGTPPAPSTGSATSATSPTTSPVTATQTGSLAATGVPRMLLWIVASGCLLVVVGAEGRRRFGGEGT